MFQQVPQPWGEGGKGYPSLKPLASWFKDLCCAWSSCPVGSRRDRQSRTGSHASSSRKASSPSALQAYARRYKEPIDLLEFVPTVKPYKDLDEVPAPPEDGVYIHGMFVEGARFDAEANAMAEPILASSLPR